MIVAINARRLVVAFALLIATTCSGCAGISKSLGIDRDVQAEKAARKERVVKDFQQRTNMAQHQAALTRYRAGGVDEAREMLEKLATESPDHLPARLTLAELLLVEDEVDEALGHIRFVLAAAPNDASARHLEGMALEAKGELEAAEKAYQQAATLDPRNDIYRMSFEAAVDAEPGRRGAARIATGRYSPQATPAVYAANPEHSARSAGVVTATDVTSDGAR